MKSFVEISLYIHMLTGLISFITGAIAIIAKKGSKPHRLSGKIYFICMYLVVFTSLIVSIYKNNIFLLLIGLFTFYMVWAGTRSIYNKSLKPSFLDWLFLFIAVLTAGIMVYSMQIILLVFACIFIFNIIGEFKLFIHTSKGRKPKSNQWLLRHLGMMLGSYIATTTAFLVVNVQEFQPYWLPWIGPTIIVTPLIFYYSRKQNKQSL